MRILVVFAVALSLGAFLAPQAMSAELPSTWSQIKALYNQPSQDVRGSLTPESMVGVAPYNGELIGPWYWPHYAVDFQIPHSTYGIQRICAVSTSCCDNGIGSWTVDRGSIGNGMDRFRILVPKRFRLLYSYLTNAEFNRFFFLWCTY